MSSIAYLFTNDKMPVGVSAICGYILAKTALVSPVGGFVYRTVSAISFSFVDSYLENRLTPHHLLSSMAAKIAAFALPLIAAPIGGVIVVAGLGFKFSVLNTLFLSIANPICIKITLSAFDLILHVHRIAQAERELGLLIARGQDRE